MHVHSSSQGDLLASKLHRYTLTDVMDAEVRHDALISRAPFAAPSLTQVRGSCAVWYGLWTNWKNVEGIRSAAAQRSTKNGVAFVLFPISVSEETRYTQPEMPCRYHEHNY